VISPLLANIYLHYVFDLWAQRWRQREARGKLMIIRYADDIVVGFQQVDDAKRFHADMQARLAQFALALHAEKAHLIEFGKYAAEHRARRGERRPETFNFLGFTHVCAEPLCRRQNRPPRGQIKAKHSEHRDSDGRWMDGRSIFQPRVGIRFTLRPSHMWTGWSR
jgi:RNA-directed DNA polymerase